DYRTAARLARRTTCAASTGRRRLARPRLPWRGRVGGTAALPGVAAKRAARASMHDTRRSSGRHAAEVRPRARVEERLIPPPCAPTGDRIASRRSLALRQRREATRTKPSAFRPLARARDGSGAPRASDARTPDDHPPAPAVE